jgi:HAE1 family hydrophobic/amphiphilic exporter-1
MFAQETTNANQVTAVPSAQEDSNNPRALRLSLGEAIATSARENLGVDIQRYDYRETGYSARATYGIFDPLAFADVSTASQKNPVASSITSSQNDRRTADFGLTQTVPTGGSYTVGFNNSRGDSSNVFNTTNPSYNSDLGISFKQPLLRNFGVDITRRGINIARNNLGISREAFRDVLSRTALAVERAYLDLIFARRNLAVKYQSRSLAAEQERITQIRIDVGASAPLDILQPRVAVATREEEVISAEASVRNAEDRLRQLMNLPPSEWDRPIVPTDDVAYQPVQFDQETSVAQAFARRPEIEEARLGTDIRRIQHRYARNQVLPQLDLRADYGIAGLGGNQIIRDPETGVQTGVIRGGYNDALSQLGGIDFPSWTLGVNFGVPIRNITARSEEKRTELELERSQTLEEQTKQNIAVEVRQAIRDIDTLSRQIAATRTAREAAERNVDAERKRFQNGMTTNFNVLQIQQELSDTRSREIAAVVAYNQAVANYHHAVGDLLERDNISVDVPEDFDLPTSRFEKVDWMNYEHWLRGEKK